MKSSNHICSKETEIALMSQKQDQIVKQVNEIHKAIMGNGRPGLLRDVQELQNLTNTDRKLIKENKEEIMSIKKIIDNLNLKMGLYAGAIAVIVFIIVQLPNWISLW